MEHVREFLKRNVFCLTIFFILFFFIGTHLAGIHSPYHQDEYKWVHYSHPEIIPPGTVPHPPLTEFLYTKIGPLVGDNNFRVIPFFFGLMDLFLVFYLTKLIFNKKTALVASVLFTISFYSLLATLMVDVDGAVMPFFFLLMLIGYYKIKQVDFQLKQISWQSLVLVVVGAICGFLVKVVCAIPIGVLALDYALHRRIFSDKKKIFKFISYSVLGAIGLVVILVLSKFIFPSFNLSYSLKYWEHFANFGNRGWFQTFIQFAKAVLYSSPLLLVPLVFLDKEIIKRTQPILLFLITELVFYIFVFDFSVGALDRYFELMVVPLCIISAAIYVKFFENEKGIVKKSHVVVISLVTVFIFLLQFISQSVPALYPKTEWVSRFFSLKWNFLYPFSGGSGPLGFYVSFLFMAIAWIACGIAGIVFFWKPKFKRSAVVFLIVMGVVYNGVFIEEYLFGGINGSASTLLYHAVEFIKNNKAIDKITVYNDNGGYNIEAIGKYEHRLYTAPYFTGQFEYLNANKGYYLVVDVPRIDPNSFYIPYFNSCKVLYSEFDKYISANVYDCHGVPDAKK